MNKNKKAIIAIIITVLLAIACVLVYFYFPKEENKENNKVDNDNTNDTIENIEYKYEEYGVGFFCSNEPLGREPSSYMVGEYVYCAISFEINGTRPGIGEIWAEYVTDEDIEYIETKKESTEWDLKEEGNKFHLTTKEPTTYDEYFYQVTFRIKNTKKEKLNITFKNIRYKDEKNNYYKTDDEVIELTMGELTNYNYKQSKNNDSFVFYKLDSNTGYKEINKYTCKSDSCYEYVSQCTGYIDLDKGKMLLHDGDNALLYDFEKGIIGTYSIGVEKIGDYFIVKDTKTQKYGIIDTNGKVIKKFNSDALGKSTMVCLDEDTYSIESNLIVEKKDNKYGIIRITKDEVVVEHKFDDIRLYNKTYFKAKVDNNWYLYSLTTKEKAIEDGYQELFIVNDNIIVTQIDKKLYIKDYQGNNLTESTIDVLVPYNEGACCGAVNGIYIHEENNTIKIYIDELVDEKEYKYNQHIYEYNIKTKKLTKQNEL